MKNAKKHYLVITMIQLNCVQAAMMGFVVGGEDTDILRFPHSAFLEARCLDGSTWICGSAILNQRLILTAAHCVTGCDWEKKGNRLITFVGHADLKEVTTRRKIKDVRIHMEFNDLTMENDIAVAMLRKDITLGPTVKRVIITKEYPSHAKQGFVAGWGLIRDDMEMRSIILKHVNQKLRSMETCSLIGRLHEGMFCAGSTEKSAEHPARGDSGSALVTPLGYHQIGLVSFCIKRFPALMVYTNVSYYYDWIQENADYLYCDKA